MKKIIFLFCILFGLINLSYSQSTWFKFWGGAFSDVANSIVLTRDNNILVVEFKFNYSPVEYYRTYLTKFNLAGNLLWQKYFDPSSSLTAIEDQGGNIYFPRDGKNLCKLDQYGNLLWVKQFNDSLLGFMACGFKFSSNYQNIISTSDINYKIILTKLDSTGNFIWTKNLKPYDTASANYRTGHQGLLVTNNSYYIVGSSNISNVRNGLIIKTDTSGNILWKLNNFTATVFSLNTIVQVSNSTFIACGVYLGPFGNYRPYYLKFDSSGNIIWQRGHDSTFNYGQMIKTFNNKIVITRGGGSSDSIGFTTIDTLGNVLSIKYQTYHPDDYISYYSIQQTIDSGFVIGGAYRPYNYSEHLGSGSYCLVVKTDKNGNTVLLKLNSQYTEIPNSFSLSQNYPNPFNPSTKISFAIPPYEGGKGNVSLKIFDILGREVSTLVNEQLKPGSYEVEWDATNYPSGVYFYKLIAGDYTESKRMLLIK